MSEPSAGGPALGPKKRRETVLTVPEWGCDVLVRELSVCEDIERAVQQRQAKDKGEPFDWVASLVARAVVDPTTRQPLYNYEEVESFSKTEDFLKVVAAVFEVNVASQAAAEKIQGE